MARAKAGRFSPEILYEDLCFDAQQTVEKCLKSISIIHQSTAYKFNHSVPHPGSGLTGALDRYEKTQENKDW